MKAISRFIVKLADLVEAEAREFRAGSVWVGVALALSLSAAALGVAGVGFLVFSIFTALRTSMGPAGAGAVIGVLLLGGAGGLLWIVIRKFAR